jgi:membrane fusion protein, heavy metal efflux system
MSLYNLPGRKVRSSARFSASGFCSMSSAVVVALMLLAPAPLAAHEGHDHGPVLAPLPVTVQPRAGATADEFEAVAILVGATAAQRELMIIVDSFATNVPVGSPTIISGVTTPSTDSVVTVTVGALELKAQPTADGTYRVAWPAALGAGKHDLVIAVQAGATSDLLLATLEVPPVAVGVSSAVAKPSLLDRLRGRSANASPNPAVPVPQPTFAVTGDAPRRLADGSVFVPKPTQRLLDVRTELVREALHRPSQTLVGRVIANPNRSGHVQSSTGGRITPPKTGLPKLGQTVKVGDVLAYVSPAFQAIDSANVAQTAGDLEQQIELARAKHERAQRLLASNVGTRVQAEEAELVFRSLERRRATLTTSQLKAEPLVAPVDGVISAARAVPGQVVAPQDILFEIIDVRSLWVEALVFDATASQTFEQPVASTQSGTSLPLTFVGRSRSLRQQSAVLHFEIATPPASLDVGTPVTVHAQAGEAISGIVLPKSAVVRSANGEDIVWRHTDPERFVPAPVRISPFDGARVLVQAGLGQGQRIVVQGAELISQVR